MSLRTWLRTGSSDFKYTARLGISFCVGSTVDEGRSDEVDGKEATGRRAVCSRRVRSFLNYQMQQEALALSSGQRRPKVGRGRTHMRGPRSDENSQWKMRMILLSRLQGTMGCCSRKVSTSRSRGKFTAFCQSIRGQAAACTGPFSFSSQVSSPTPCWEEPSP